MKHFRILHLLSPRGRYEKKLAVFRRQIGLLRRIGAIRLSPLVADAPAQLSA